MAQFAKITLMAALATSVTAVLPAKADDIWVTLDQARMVKLDGSIGSIVVSNPAIADIKVHSTQELILFGKLPGPTKIFIFDKSGRPMDTLAVRVQNPRNNMVTMYSGVERFTMSCTSVCEHTYTLGDGVRGLVNGGQDMMVQAQNRALMAAGMGVTDQVAGTRTEVPMEVKPASGDPDS